MTRYQATRTASAPRSSGAGAIDIKTLVITAASSAAAAYACSKLWAPGTLAAAAFTPVLVAIIREALAKSTDVVVKAVPVRGVVRSARIEGPRLPADPEAAEPPPVVAGDPIERVPQPGEISYHGGRRRGRHWRLAVVTGLLGFLVAAVAFTVPELIAGQSAAGGGRGTTLFGGEEREGAPAVTTTAPPRTVTAPPAETVTVAPQTVTAPPAATAPEAQTATTTVPTTTAPPVGPPPAASP